MSADTIADFITSMQNAAIARRDTFVAPYSKLLHAVADVLIQKGYLRSIEKRGKKVTKNMLVTLAFEQGTPKINGTRRVSKLSRRVYAGAKATPSVRHGAGFTVLTTSKGLMSDVDARKANVGGEPLFQIW